MKVKTSVTLTPQLIEAIDQQCGAGGTRSEFLEKAAWEVIRARLRRERGEKDKRIYAQHANELNAEAEDVLAMQAAWAEDLEPDDEAW